MTQHAIAPPTWQNQDNNAFYESIKAEGMQQFAENAGLVSCCDLELLRPYWSKAQSILEVGAGYGRVVDYLLQHEFTGHITAVERCNVLFDHLKKQFAETPNIHLVHADIMESESLEQQFDLILLVWGSIANFAFIEQPRVIQTLKYLLNTQGTLIIETMPAHLSPLCTKAGSDRQYELEVDNAAIYVNLPTLEEIKHYAENFGFQEVRYIPYLTDKQHQRFFCIIR